MYPETFQAIWARETLTVLRSLLKIHIYTHWKPEELYKGLNNFLSCSPRTTLLLRIADFLPVQAGRMVYPHTMLVPFPTVVFQVLEAKTNSLRCSFTPKIGDNLLNFITD